MTKAPIGITKIPCVINPCTVADTPLAENERRANMAKTFFVKRTPEGTKVTANTLACALRHLKKTEKRHGQASRKTVEASLLLAAMYCVVEDYEEAEPLLKRCMATAKNRLPQNADALSWANALLAEAYGAMNRIPEAFLIMNEGKSISRILDHSAPDMMFEALWKLALSFEADHDAESRQRGFVAALMALCWFVTRGLNRSRADAHRQEDLRLHFSLDGIVLDEWRWLIKHAHLTRYDFVGLLSIVLHNADLSPVSVQSWIKREPRVIEVR